MRLPSPGSTGFGFVLRGVDVEPARRGVITQEVILSSTSYTVIGNALTDPAHGLTQREALPLGLSGQRCRAALLRSVPPCAG
jgi:hypothetical protein